MNNMQTNEEKGFERMINGHEAKETIGRLSRALDAQKILEMKGDNPDQIYYAYRARLDEVIGETNYDYVSDQLDVKSVQGRDVFTCSGTLIIKDDRGLAVKTIKAYGGTSILSNGTVSVGNDIEYAMRSAFINCFKMLSVSTARQVEDGSSSSNNAITDTSFQSSNKGMRNSYDNSKSKPTYAESSEGFGALPAGFGKVFKEPEKKKNVTSSGVRKQIYNVRLLQALTSLGNGGYKSRVYVQELGREMPFRIFKEGIESIEAGGTNASVFLSRLSVGVEFSFLGFLNEYNGTEQLVMESVAG